MGTWIAQTIKIVFRYIIEIIYPSSTTCVCGEGLEERDEEIGICNRCIKKIKKSFEYKLIDKGEGISVKCYSFSYYNGLIKEMVLALKYKSNFNYGEILGFLLFKHINELGLTADIITYVPMSKADEKRRGFNQSEILAKVLGRHLKKEVKALLVKKRLSKDQIGLDFNQRWENLTDCYILKNKDKDKEKFALKRIFLVDDVFTTGATAYFCVKNLKKINCEEVIVLTVAKSTI